MMYLKDWEEKNNIQELCLGKWSFKNKKVKIFLSKQELESMLLETCFTRNAKDNTSGWNERTLEGNSKLYEEIKISSKYDYIGKYQS